MSKHNNPSNYPRKQGKIRSLKDDLEEIDVQTQTESAGETEMLSLMVDEALKGVDIPTRYPTFYRSLLHNNDLRQAFTDALESVEAANRNELVSLPQVPDLNLNFLAEQQPHAILTKINDKWHIGWQRTVEQLQKVLSPSQLVYRFNPAYADDAWLTLLRAEIEVEGVLYAVVLECTLSEDSEEALSPFLNIAVTVGVTTNKPQFPVQTSIRWGNYDETLEIGKEGRRRFPDIPFKTIFDEAQKNIKAELQLTLEPPT